MNIYDKFVEALKSAFGTDPKETLVTGVETSSVLAAELLFMASILIATLTIRLISPALMIFVEVLLIILFAFGTPLMPKLFREHNDDLDHMMFYAVLALTIISMVFYWGAL